MDRLDSSHPQGTLLRTFHVLLCLLAINYEVFSKAQGADGADSQHFTIGQGSSQCSREQQFVGQHQQEAVGFFPSGLHLLSELTSTLTPRRLAVTSAVGAAPVGYRWKKMFYYRKCSIDLFILCFCF